MFENVTFETILNRMLGRVPVEVDKREGSIIYDAVAPAAVELQLMYLELDNILNETFADTASEEYLYRRAAERNIVPKAATAAVAKGEFTPENIDVLGQRFNLGDLNYTAIEKISDGVYRMECETAGSIGNSQTGNLLPIDYIDGLKTAKLTEILIYGEDEEDVESVRARYYASINDMAFGGNIAEYKEKVGAMEGVGGVRVYRADDWNGAGTVRIAVTTSENTAPSKELLTKIKEELDPEDYTGGGKGLAPIGHQVTVTGAENYKIDISLTIDIRIDSDKESITTKVKDTVRDYILSVNENWAANVESKIYISGIIAAVKDIAEVIDVYNVKINGNGENLSLEGDDIADIGKTDINVVEV